MQFPTAFFLPIVKELLKLSVPDQKVYKVDNCTGQLSLSVKPKQTELSLI